MYETTDFLKDNERYLTKVWEKDEKTKVKLKIRDELPVVSRSPVQEYYYYLGEQINLYWKNIRFVHSREFSGTG